MSENRDLSGFSGKRVRIVQKDGFVKSGVCTGFGVDFLFLKYNDGSNAAVALDSIVEIKIMEGEKW